MISIEKLRQPAVRAFIESLNDRDEKAFAEAVHEKFTYTHGEEEGDAAGFYTAHIQFVVTDQSSDGFTLTGVMLKTDDEVAVRLTFFPAGYASVGKLGIATDVEIPSDSFIDALAHLGGGRAQAKPAVGTLRRLKLGDHYFVHRWGRGAMGSADWINTGEKAPDPDVYQSFHSPAHGEQTDEVRVSRVVSRLSVDLGWDGTYQKATARFHATLSFWEAVKWLPENLRLAGTSIPKITGTLTLTGPPTLTVPGGTVISTEEITVTGSKPPYPIDFTREFPLTGLPLGTYTLTLANAVKTGGYWSSKYNTTIAIKDHTISFTVGG
ncbi:nuclear transport factor 2 family protein [Streptomyces anulatus]